MQKKPSTKQQQNSTKTLHINTSFYLLRTTNKTYLNHLGKKLNGSVHINPLQSGVTFLYPLKTSENL